MSRTAPTKAGPVPAPPGMPPAVAWHRNTPSFAVVSFFVVAGFLVVFAALKGARLGDSSGLLLYLAVVVVGIGGLISLQVYREELAAGPGWFSQRGYFRRHWVRTDQLVEIKSHTVGPGWAFVLQDADGRKVGVTMSSLRNEPGIAAQLIRDVRRSLDAGLAMSDRTRRLLFAIDQ